MKTETIALKTNLNVTLTTYLLDSSGEMPNVAVRPAVMVFPGGGYRSCSDREAEPIAMAFVAQGYHAFVLRYSLNENAAFPKPLQDAEEALELVRAKAEDWGVNPHKIAACGFSAGAHLAAALGTMGRVRPDALILGYPLILESLSKLLPFPVPSLETKVDAQTPPAFIFHTTNDSTVPVAHSLQFAAALDQAGIPFELHIFQDGEHGLALARPLTSAGYKAYVNPEVARWVKLCAAWLEKCFGAFAADQDLPKIIRASHATEYNLDVALEVCWANPECKKVVLAYFPGIEQFPNLDLAMYVSLKMLNAYTQALTPDMLEKLEHDLKAVPFEAVQPGK